MSKKRNEQILFTLNTTILKKIFSKKIGSILNSLNLLQINLSNAFWGGEGNDLVLN